MVFSFFKKDPKDSKPRGASARPRPTSERSSKSASNSGQNRFSSTENTQSNRDFHRSLAMETAAKIDAIESEMTRDFLRPMGNNGANAANSAFVPSGSKADKSAAPARAKDVGEGADDDLGNIDAIEIHTSGAGSVIDETAILFANGLVAEAQNGLSTALGADTVGQNVQTAWQMLFELVNQGGDRNAFEKLTMDYVLRFGHSPPSWMDYDAPAPAAQVQSFTSTPAPAAATTIDESLGGIPRVQLPEKLNADIIKYLEQLKAHAATSPALALDVSAVQSIDLVAAELLLRVINAFKRAAHELTLLGLDQLCEALQRTVQAGRRDESDAAWMLLLEVLRLLERQHDFEETGIQYCITFEVSPPSWEPISPNLKVKSVPRSAPVAAVVAENNDPLQWRGQIEGEGEPHFGRIAVVAQDHKGPLVIECRQLRRMAFSSGSALLNLALRLQQGGVTLELRNVNALVGALLHLLGVTAVASVQLRRE